MATNVEKLIFIQTTNIYRHQLPILYNVSCKYISPEFINIQLMFKIRENIVILWPYAPELHCASHFMCIALHFFSSKKIYHDLCTTGLLNTTINQWVTLSFCLPQKAHQFHKKGVVVEPEAIDRCLQSLKPYHGMLLLVDLTEMLDCVPPSGARMLLQLINAYNPLKTLQNMASEADLAIKHVRFWGQNSV